MRIGIDARLYRASVAGIGRYSQNLVKNLLEIDSKNQYCLILTPADAEECNLEYPNLEIKIVNIPHYSLSEQTKLPKILSAEKFDLMHFLNFNVPVRYQGKFVVTIHDLTLFFYPGRSRNNFIYKSAYRYIFGSSCRKASKIIAVSQSTKKDIEKVFRINSSKIEVVYEAADDRVFASPGQETITELKNNHKIDADPVILYVGQWRPHKNLVGLIQAFDLLRQEMPVKLAIVGKPDNSFPEVRQAIDKSPFSRDIMVLGFVSDEDLAAWYKIASVFVFPSFYEGFGLPGLEAMIAELPVVSSDRTSLPEIYGQAAVYFDPGIVEGMKEKIKQVLLDQSLQKKLVENGKKVLERYSWKKTAQETLSVYRQVEDL